jgi:hypothetical protein
LTGSFVCLVGCLCGKKLLMLLKKNGTLVRAAMTQQFKKINNDIDKYFFLNNTFQCKKKERKKERKKEICSFIVYAV